MSTKFGFCSDLWEINEPLFLIENYLQLVIHIPMAIALHDYRLFFFHLHVISVFSCWWLVFVGKLGSVQQGLFEDQNKNLHQASPVQ